MVGLVLRDAAHQHLQLDHAQRGVIEHEHLDRQLVQLNRQQLAHEHGQSAVAREGDDLAARVGLLRADGLRQGVCHGAVAEGADLLALAIRGDVARAPDVAHAGIDGEDGVIVGFLVNEVRDVLRVDRGVLFHVGGICLDDVLQLVVVLLEHLVQEGAVLLLLHVRQDVVDGGGNVTGHGVGDLGAAADVGTVDIHLRHVALRQEVVIWEVRAKEDQQVRLVGGLVRGAVTQ